MRNIKLLWGLIVCLLSAVLVLGLLFAVRGCSDPNAAQPGGEQGKERIVAKIGDREFKIGVLEESLLHKYGPELLSQLLDREALRLESEQQGMKIGREEVDAELKRMQLGYESEEQFYESMRTQVGMTKEEIREDVYYKLLMERIATKNIKVSDTEVETYISEHPEEFQSVISLRIQIIVNKTADQARRTIELYKSGRDFAQLAKERSLDTVLASDGGDLGWVEDNDPFVPQEILKAAQGLQPGEIAGPVQTADGYAVVRLKDKKERTKGTKEQIRESVRKMLSLQKAPPMQEVVESLRDKFKAVILDPSLQR